MVDKRLAISGFLGGIGLGVVMLASPSVSGPLEDFTKGFLGMPLEFSERSGGTAQLRAELALPALSTPLQNEQLDELFQGLAFLFHDQYRSATPILGKYALMGEGKAQSAIGAMYYFGKGLPLDREEGIRWLQLAAAHGSQVDVETLAAATSGTWEWEDSGSVSALADAGIQTSTPQPELPSPILTTSSGSRYAQDWIGQDGGAVTGGSAASESYESASRKHIGAGASQPQLSIGSPIILNRAGPGTYSDGNGDIYTQAGPHGVVNTRTGEFSPAN